MRWSNVFVFASLIVALVLIAIYLPAKTGFIINPLHPHFSLPESGYLLSSYELNFQNDSSTLPLTISVEDDYIFSKYYTSFNGEDWVQGSFGGNGWITSGSVSKTLILSPSDFGLTSSNSFSEENYVIIYSCGVFDNGKRNCYDKKWQLYQFNVSLASTISPPTCGNAILETGEECDEGTSNGNLCSPSYGSSCDYCSSSCTLETVQGGYCGDNIINGNEQCDGPIANDQCTSLGYDYGTFSCSSCSYDTSQCGYNQPVLTGLIAYYDFNEGSGSSIGDSVNNYDGDLNGPTWVSGVSGTALKFDGINDLVTISDPGETFSEATISFWAKVNNLPTSHGQTIFQTGWGYGEAEYLLIMKEGSNFRIDIDDGDNGCGRKELTTSAGSYLDNQWHHFALTYVAQDSAKFYVDGVQKGSTLSLVGCEPEINPSSSWMLGRHTTSPLSYFNGTVDELKVFDSALNLSEIQTLANVSVTPECTVDGDCPSNEICQNGVCIPETVTWTCSDSDGSNTNTLGTVTLTYSNGTVTTHSDYCSGSSLQESTCVGNNLVWSTVSCTNGCSGGICLSPTQVCGDGVVNGTEVCDGTNLTGETCSSQGFGSGDLACSNDCLSFDTSGCTQASFCGDNTCDADETCSTCESDCGCSVEEWCSTSSDSCELIVPVSCVDSDGLNSGIKGNVTVTYSDGSSTLYNDYCGTNYLQEGSCQNNDILWNNVDCLYGCVDGTCASPTQICGNNVVEGTEQCDGTSIPNSCTGLGFEGGILSCYASGTANECTFDTTQCETTGGTGGNSSVEFNVSALFLDVDPSDYANVYYIDPTYTGTSTGTINQPYKDLSFLSTSGSNYRTSSNSAYFFKKGTELVLTNYHISFAGDDHVALSYYGTGEKPLIRSTFCTGGTGIIYFGGPSDTPSDLIVDGLDLFWDGESNNCGSSPQAIVGGQTTNGVGSDITVQDSILRSSFNHNYSTYNVFRHVGGKTTPYDSGTHLIGNELAYSSDDLVYVEWVDDLQVIGNYLHDPNLRWFKYLETNPNGVLCPENGVTYMYCPGEAGKGDGMPESCANDETLFPYDCGGDTIQAVSGENQVFKYNLFNKTTTGNKFNLLVSNTRSYRPSGLEIEGNVFYGPLTTNGAANTIGVYSRDDVSISNNRIFAPFNTGIYDIQTNYAEVFGNIISGENTAMQINAGVSHIYNNIFNSEGGTYGTLWLPGGTAYLKNNIFSTIPAVKYIHNTQLITQSSNNLYISSASGMSGSSLVADPEFVDSANENFHLQSTSPAIDAGTNVGASYNVDIDGNTRGGDGSWDIGAYEYVEGTTGGTGGGGGGASLIPTTQNLLVAFIGDSGAGTNFQNALNLISSEGADLVIHNGDFSYDSPTTTFVNRVDNTLGNNYVYVGSNGNHDTDEWGDIRDGCTDSTTWAGWFNCNMQENGFTPVYDDNYDRYSFEYEGLKVVFGSQAIDPTGNSDFVNQELSDDNHIWKICGWHKNQQTMQVGSKTNEVGWAPFQACLENGAIISMGHEHSYERTKTLTDFQNLVVDTNQHPLVGGVPSNPNEVVVDEGKSFAFVSGAGGYSFRDQTRCTPTSYPYGGGSGCNYIWGNIYANQQGLTTGVLFIKFYVDGNPNKAHAYFKNVNGQIIDEFDIYKGAPSAISSNYEKPRVVVMSDIGGSEPDDQETFVRFLLYSNEMDVEGLIGTNSQHGWDRGDTSTFNEIIDAYGSVLNNLQVQDPNYPSDSYLHSVVKLGQTNCVDLACVGSGKSTEGSNHIISVLNENDDRPVWFMAWGGTLTLAQALWDMENTLGYSQAQMDQITSKIKVYDIAGQDSGGAWIVQNYPNIFYTRSAYQFLAFAQGTGNPSESQRGDLSVASLDWFNSNIRNNHDPYGDKYPLKIYMWEGDSPSITYFINNGLGDVNHPYYGSWGGRFTEITDSTPPRRDHGNENVYPGGMYTDEVSETWLYGSQTYTDQYSPLYRWREEYQNDFAARMDWTLTSNFNSVNHAPNVVLNGDSTKSVLMFSANVGGSISLDASGTSDPDGDSLTYSWWVYPEPSGYTGSQQNYLNGFLNPLSGTSTTFSVPSDASSGDEFHAILEVKDDGTGYGGGSLPLTRYRRAVITVN